MGATFYGSNILWEQPFMQCPRKNKTSCEPSFCFLQGIHQKVVRYLPQTPPLPPPHLHTPGPILEIKGSY